MAAGYLWLLLAWLIADPSPPDSSASTIYGTLGEVLETIGPIGHAIAASVGAYLLGSLITAMVLWLIRDLNARWIGVTIWHTALGARPEPDWELSDIRPGQWVTVELEDIAFLAGIGEMHEAMRRSDLGLVRSIEEIADRELGGAHRQLEAAIDSALTEADGLPALEVTRRGSTAVAKFRADDADAGLPGPREIPIPRFSPVRELFKEFPILRTRLIEHAEATGLKVERLHSEAEFRIAVAVPLFALLLVFAGEHALWLAALVVPIALAWQGVVLVRQGNRELVDALRARSGTEDLIQITPLFSRYRSEAKVLSEAIRSERWSAPRTPTRMLRR